MAINNNKDKERQSLLNQTVQQNNSSNLLIKEPIDRNVAGLHNTGVTPPEGFEGSAKSVYTHNDSQSGVTDEMNANSKLWWDAKAAGDTDMMKSLEAANKQLAALLGDGVTYNPTSGTWSGVANMPATKQAAMLTGVDPQLPSYDSNAWLTENPAPTYQSAYDAKIDELMNAMLNREKFSYDAESDPLYQQYKNIYTREGNRSMNDTLAAAASGAGGMSSYAMTAAQQANNYYMAQLGDKIPELQQLAYSMYMDDLNLQRQDINMLQSQDSYKYGQYRDAMNDWYNNRDFGYGQYRDQMGDYQWGTNLNYGAYRDQVADDQYKTEWEHALEREAVEDAWRKTEWDYGVSRDGIEDAFRDKQFNYGVSQDQVNNAFREKQFNYGVSQDAVQNNRYSSNDAYDRAMDLLSLGVMPDSSVLSAAGISQEQAKTIMDGGWGNDPNAGKPPSNPETEAEKEKRYDASKMAIGLGMFNDEIVLNLSDYGGIVFNDDGSISWGPGWNKDNWRKKLEEYQNGLFTFGMIGG